MLTIGSTYHRTGVSPRRGATLSSSARNALRAALAACVATLLLGAGVARAAPALVIAGAGDGHGVGMSQDGALGYAEHGWTYQAILAHYYTGTALGQAPAGATVRVLVGSKVQTLALETYVRGVVAAEMPAGWPLAALEAQAVASRTYALTAHAGGRSKIGQQFDVYADTRSQVYRGVAAETPQTDAAIADTAGQILTYEGSPAITYFFASSGGRTENVENGFPGAQPQPWLRGVADAYESDAVRLEAEHPLRHGGSAPEGPRQGELPRHRSALARVLAAHPQRRGARLGRRDAGERAGTGGPAGPRLDMGLLQRQDRHYRQTRAGP